MNVTSKIAAALAVVAVAASLVVPTSSAQAGKGFGIGAALVGGAIVGGAIAAHSAPYGGYYVEGRRCRFERQYDAYGFYVGTAKVCRYY